MLWGGIIIFSPCLGLQLIRISFNRLFLPVNRPECGIYRESEHVKHLIDSYFHIVPALKSIEKSAEIRKQNKYFSKEKSKHFSVLWIHARAGMTGGGTFYEFIKVQCLSVFLRCHPEP